MEKLVDKLDAFEGPLDVLLYLISKNKLNIYDIPIADLLDQYLDYLHSMREMDLEVTSDFLSMASRLVQIKSEMLLPQREDEENDPRRELMMSLIGYKTCRAMAQRLRERSCGFDCFVRCQQPMERDVIYTRHHKPEELADAFLSVKGRVRRRQPPPVTAFRGVVGRKAVSVASRVVHVIKRLIKGGPSRIGSLYADARGRSELVATFLALLELIRSRRITVEDENGEETVKIVRGGR